MFEVVKENLKRFKYLWEKVPADCKLGLIVEFLFEPYEFDVRYYNEVKFREELYRRWEEK